MQGSVIKNVNLKVKKSQNKFEFILWWAFCCKASNIYYYILVQTKVVDQTIRNMAHNKFSRPKSLHFLEFVGVCVTRNASFPLFSFRSAFHFSWHFFLMCLSFCAVRRCSPLFAPDNGYMKCDSDGDNYGATCQFTCTGGYELRGSAARVCQYGLSWSGTDTTCAGTNCMRRKLSNLHKSNTAIFN